MIVTDVQYTTVDAEDVIVYVDGYGKPVTTKTIHHIPAIPTQAQSSVTTPMSSAASTSAQFSKPKASNLPNPEPTPSPSHSAPSPPPPSQPAPKIQPMPPAYQPAPPASQPALSPPKVSFAQEPSQSSPLTSESPALAPPAPASLKPPASAPTVNVPLLPAPPKTPFSPSGPGFSSGVSYSPYNADNTCKSTAQVANDFKLITGFSVIRLYGTDCGQIANVQAAIKNTGVSLFLGIFDLTQIPSECNIIIDAVKGDWSHINTVSVGNELVNKGAASVGQVTAAIAQVRSTLKAAGYKGPVVTVDTMVAMKANPELCQASDFCAINCHAFFDGNVLPEGAGPFVLDWAQQVSKAAGGKTVVVTETGWPTQGNANNKAVPSKENHDAAIASIKKIWSQNAILYTAFNDLWKQDSAATFGAEKHWGILGDAPSS